MKPMAMKPMAMRPTAQEALLAALVHRAAGRCGIEYAISHDWASVTFTGARHEIALRLPRGIVEAFVDGIEEADLALRGHLLADLIVVGRALAAADCILRLEALTVEDL